MADIALINALTLGFDGRKPTLIQTSADTGTADFGNIRLGHRVSAVADIHNPTATASTLLSLHANTEGQGVNLTKTDLSNVVVPKHHALDWYHLSLDTSTAGAHSAQIQMIEVGPTGRASSCSPSTGTSSADPGLRGGTYEHSNYR